MPTSANIVVVLSKRTQHVRPNNVRCYWPTMLRPFAWVFTSSSEVSVNKQTKATHATGFWSGIDSHVQKACFEKPARVYTKAIFQAIYLQNVYAVYVSVH